MKCYQCKYVKVCMAQSDMLGQVFDVNYDGEHGCEDFTPFTNADRICAMSDEELAIWIETTSTVCECCSRLNDCVAIPSCDKCVANITEWLKQPAKEEVDDG